MIGCAAVKMCQMSFVSNALRLEGVQDRGTVAEILV